MNNPSFKELSEISSSRYEICMTKEVEDKPVTQALHEIMEGKVEKND
ncbi:DNA-directed RNA polymerase subunit omega [Anaerococcus vaginalis]|nr:DNA-directed RNA polymerase subunit omega [Anaerococcus vaginalis]MDU5460444.1 DNA-directed RNA polymerase subunit omega [Anaerococcus vaginalis]